MRYPIDVCVTPPRPEPLSILRPTNAYPHIISRWTEPELEILFHDGISVATFMGPIVKDFLRRLPEPGERMDGKVWFPILYPTDHPFR